jgi:hypothetical protein
MKTRSNALRYLVVTVLGLLGACTGGGVNVEISGPDITPFTWPWTDEAMTAYGVNTGFGQVVVNDVVYGTYAAEVVINDRFGQVSDLRRGQVITVSGDVYGGSFSGRANRIEYEARVIGPVEELDAAAGRLVVMGQTITSNANTIFAAGIDAVTYAGLRIGSNAEVSGFVRADGAILATRIGPFADGAKLRLIGDVANLDLGNLRFKVADLVVDYSAALVIDLPGGAPGNGETIRMTGDLSAGRFIVETLARAPALTGFTGQRVQAGGLVTRFVSPSDFFVNHFAIVTAPGTEFRNGDRADLGLNAGVVIDGHLRPGGVVAADRVTFGLGNFVLHGQ